jgi:hypothetical protein
MAQQRTVSSVFDNLAQILSMRAPRAGLAMLGARWSFELPIPGDRASLCEYSIPGDLVDTLARRTGLHISEHDGSEPLDPHLRRGDTLIVAVDSFYLPYRPAYGRVHSGRTVLIKAGAFRDQVWIEDRWQPVYAGPMERRVLEPARYSPVPQDRLREPIFAGRIINGDWFSVELEDRPLADVRAWSTEILANLVQEGIAGIARLARFRNDLAHEVGLIGHAIAREASLILRAELSTRVFLCSFLRAAAGWRGDPNLRAIAELYYNALDSMEMARDLLTKNLTHSRWEYQPLLLDWLARTLETEDRLGCALTR